jgi:hypothetical protein
MYFLEIDVCKDLNAYYFYLFASTCGLCLWRVLKPRGSKKREKTRDKDDRVIDLDRRAKCQAAPTMVLLTATTCSLSA